MYDANHERTPSGAAPAPERVMTAIAGSALLYWATRLSASGRIGRQSLLLVTGAALLARAAAGRSSIRATRSGRARHDTREALAGDRGIRVREHITINRPAEQVFHFWRAFDQLPQFMDHLQSVEVLDSRRSRWTARAPLGATVTWEAEIINEREPDLIAWRSVEGSDVVSAGSVHFVPAPGGRGTEVRVALQYAPPGGKLGWAFARAFGEAPAQQIREDLRRLKQLLETGETATIVGQTSGRAVPARERRRGVARRPAHALSHATVG